MEICVQMIMMGNLEFSQTIFFQQFWDRYPLLSTLVSSAKVTTNYPGELTMLPGLTVAITNRITKKNIYDSKDSLKTRNHRAIGCV